MIEITFVITDNDDNTHSATSLSMTVISYNFHFISFRQSHIWTLHHTATVLSQDSDTVSQAPVYTKQSPTTRSTMPSPSTL